MRAEDPINVGYDRTTGRAVTVDEGTYNRWVAKGLKGDHSLVCLYCHQAGTEVPLVVCFRVGGRRRMYFRHPPGTARGGHSPETVWHVDGKLLIARWARSQPNVAGVEVERWTGDRSRRADVLITLDSGLRVAVELQTRAMTDGDWSARHRDYTQQGIVDVWLSHPSVERPGILLQKQVDVWFLDVAESSLGVPLGLPHQRPANWQSAPDISVFVLHHPPCLGDRVSRRWYPLRHTAIHDGGLRLPALLRAELREARDQLQPKPPHPMPPRIDCDVGPVAQHSTRVGPQNDLDSQVIESYVPPPSDILRQLHRYLQNNFQAAGEIRIKGRDRLMANGFPVYAGGKLIGVACPRPDHPSAWQQLNGLLVFVAHNQTRWISRAAPLGTLLRIVRSEPNQAP